MDILLMVVLTALFGYLFVQNLKQGRKLQATVDAVIVVLNALLIVVHVMKA